MNVKRAKKSSRQPSCPTHPPRILAIKGAQTREANAYEFLELKQVCLLTWQSDWQTVGQSDLQLFSLRSLLIFCVFNYYVNVILGARSECVIYIICNPLIEFNSVQHLLKHCGHAAYAYFLANAAYAQFILYIVPKIEFIITLFAQLLKLFTLSRLVAVFLATFNSYSRAQSAAGLSKTFS